ncbi:SDR family NAD(P)-dependent oxidoreductase [Geminicoccus roseus]|uniref:SDR family NAD(P)-dependent oxidoreductase n=1 Tax=Geminicoccus roseus TaxID=404900 RepID=UPI00041622FA|nr:SDR family oxidoreductase [Geminicoccus roseus]
MNRFIAKTVLVTGGGRGIGRATCLRLAQEGAAVAVADLDLAPAQEVVREIAATGRTAVALEADVTKATSVEAMVRNAEKALGPLSVLVNNAAATSASTVEATGEADWDVEFDVTLRAAYLVMKSVIPGMAERGKGAIVAIGSVNGRVYVGNPAYSAAKAGLAMWVKAMAVEYGPQGIRTNMVSPGTIRTQNRSWTDRIARDPQIFEKLARWYPVGRVGNPEDIAAAVAFLASDEAGFVNGADLVVDGGLTAGMGPFVQEING